jgi:hypothetical protein
MWKKTQVSEYVQYSFTNKKTSVAFFRRHRQVSRIYFFSFLYSQSVCPLESFQLVNEDSQNL